MFNQIKSLIEAKPLMFLGTLCIFFPVILFLLIKLIVKLLLFIYYINFKIANLFSNSTNSQKKKKDDDQNNLPNILINNRDLNSNLDSNCLINLKLMELMAKKENNGRLQTDFLEIRQKMLETQFNQKIFEIEMKQKIKDLEESKKQNNIAQQPRKNYNEIPDALRKILEKLNNVEEMQFEILKDYTQKTHYDSKDKTLYVHPEDFLHMNKALMEEKYKKLN